MNHGLGHRYYARNLRPSYYTLGSFGAMSPASFPSSLPGIGPLYPPNPVAVTSKLQTAPPAVATAAGAPAICLNQAQNAVPCSDPNCTYGDCGSTAAQVTVGALCLDQSQNQVDCSDPNCTYGDCLSTSFFTKSTIVSGVPDIAIFGGVLLLVMMLSGGGGYYMGRR